MNEKTTYAIKRKPIKLLYSAAIVIVVLGIISLLYTSRFWINDDTLMCALVSGAYNGDYNSEIVFVLQPLGWIWSRLYSFNNNIPWYGLTHLACVAISLYVLLIILLKNVKSKKQILLYTILFVLYVGSVFTYTINFPQFTTTAGFMAAGMVALTLNIDFRNVLNRQVGNYILLVLFGIVTCTMRKNIYLMIIPVLLLVVFVKLIFAGFSKKKILKAVIMSGAFVFLYLGVNFYNDFIQSPAMQNFKEYNSVRSKIADYNFIEDYKASEEFYETLDMSEAEFLLLKEGYYNIIDDKLSQDRVQQVVDNATEEKININLENITLLEEVYFSDELWNRTCVVLVLFFLSVIFMVANKQYEGLLIAAGIFLGMLLESFILAVTGRFVDRIAISMLIIDVYVIMICLSQQTRQINLKLLARILSIIGVLSCMVTVPILHESIQNREEILSKSTDIREELYDYAKNNTEYFYYYEAIDSNMLILSTSLTYNKASDFWNIERAGGWLQGSPAYKKKIQNFGFDSFLDGVEKGKIRLISLEYPTKIYSYLQNIYDSCYLEEVDYISSGYTVYDVKLE